MLRVEGNGEDIAPGVKEYLKILIRGTVEECTMDVIAASLAGSRLCQSEGRVIGGRFDPLRPRIAYICSIYTLIQRVPLLIMYENCYNAIEGLDSS